MKMADVYIVAASRFVLDQCSRNNSEIGVSGVRQYRAECEDLGL